MLCVTLRVKSKGTASFYATAAPATASAFIIVQ